MSALRIWAGLGLFLFCFPACSGDPHGRQAISGSVKVDGAPLPKGDISFQPLEGQPFSGGAEIEGGNFAIERSLGLVPGKYRVEVHAPVPGTGGGVDEEALPGTPPAPPKELIPAEWNSASTQTIDVKKQGSNVFNFDISTKKTGK